MEQEGKKVQEQMAEFVNDVPEAVCGVYLYIKGNGEYGARMANQNPQRLLLLKYFLGKVTDAEFHKANTKNQPNMKIESADVN